jgi:hypothetical protein
MGYKQPLFKIKGFPFLEVVNPVTLHPNLNDLARIFGTSHAMKAVYRSAESVVDETVYETGRKLLLKYGIPEAHTDNLLFLTL